MPNNIVSFNDAKIKQRGKTILTNVSIDVPEGSFIFLIGRTGSGKSSLIKTIYGDLELAEGIGNVTGFDLTRNTENFSFAVNFNHQDQDGLVDNTASISLSKKIQQISKLRKEREKEIPELEKLFDQLQLAKENERLAEIAGKTAEENKVMKELIIQLLKENQKLKTENKLFTNQ